MVGNLLNGIIWIFNTDFSHLLKFNWQGFKSNRIHDFNDIIDGFHASCHSFGNVCRLRIISTIDVVARLTHNLNFFKNIFTFHSTNNQKKIHDVFCFLQIGYRTIFMFDDLGIKDKFSHQIRQIFGVVLINRENFQLIFSRFWVTNGSSRQKSAAQISASLIIIF